MPRGQFLFSAVFGSRKAVRAIFSELDETKAHDLIIHGRFQKSEGETRKGSRGVMTRKAHARWEPQVEGVMRTAASFPQ